MSKHVDINSLNIIGRLTRDAELKYTNGGLAVSTFSIATDSYAGKDKESYVSFFECDYWGKPAEALNQYLTKGTQIAFEGYIKQERWEKDGANSSKVKIKAQRIQLLSKPSNQSEGPKNSYASEQNSYAEKQNVNTQAYQKDFEDENIPF